MSVNTSLIFLGGRDAIFRSGAWRFNCSVMVSEMPGIYVSPANPNAVFGNLVLGIVISPGVQPWMSVELAIGPLFEINGAAVLFRNG